MAESQEQRLQNILSQMQGYGELIEALQRQISNLASARSEMSMTLESLKTLAHIKPGTEVLVPVGSGAMIKNKVDSVDRVLVEIGSGVVVERKPEEALKVIEDRINEVDQTVKKINEDILKIQERIEKMRPEAERLLQELKRES